MSFGYECFVGVDDVGNLLGIFAVVIGKGSALEDRVVFERDFNGGYDLAVHCGSEHQRIGFEKISCRPYADMLAFSLLVILGYAVKSV